MTKKQQGIKPKARPVREGTGNQYQATPRQQEFMSHWLNYKNPKTFGNAYRSALEAGYSESYAKQITANAIANQWIQEYKRKQDLTVQHLITLLQSIATGENIDSRSKTDTQLKAIELLLKRLEPQEQTTQLTQINVNLSNTQPPQSTEVHEADYTID